MDLPTRDAAPGRERLPQLSAVTGTKPAFAATRTGVAIHAVCVMSNHHHVVVTDTNGVLPDFLRELHRLTAKALNALQGQWENLWAAEPCNAVRLVTDEDVARPKLYFVEHGSGPPELTLTLERVSVR